MNTPDPVATASSPSMPGAEERNWAMAAHLSALAGGLLSGFFGGLGVFVGPLVVWLIKKDTMPFVDEQGKEALNFNITCAIAFLILIVFSVMTLGIGLLLTVPLWLAVGIFWLVVTIIAAVKVSNGEHYRYPISLRLIS